MSNPKRRRQFAPNQSALTTKPATDPLSQLSANPTTRRVALKQCRRLTAFLQQGGLAAGGQTFKIWPRGADYG
jgi:hypothetical protein